MLKKDEGVVLGSTRSGETSKVITFFGRESGKVRLQCKGALRQRSPLRAALSPGNLIEAVFYHKEGRTLYFLKEAHVVRAAGSERDLAHAASSLAVLELLDGVCYWASPEPRVVDLFAEYRDCAACDPVLLFIGFEFKLLEILGAMPEFLLCASCGAVLDDGFYHPAEGVGACKEHTQPESHRVTVGGQLPPLLRALAKRPLGALAELAVDAAARKNLGRILHWTYTFHIQGYSLPEALKLIPKG
ncbi:MAG: DNA repair protein RecO [Candidatus Krumholzibacteriia bacterium]